VVTRARAFSIALLCAVLLGLWKASSCRLCSSPTPCLLTGDDWGQGHKAVGGFLRSSYLLLGKKSLVPICGRKIATFGHLFHLVGDQVSMLVLLDLSAASSSTDCTELLPHLQTPLGRVRDALQSLSSPFLLSAGSCGQCSSAGTVIWYK